MQQRISARSRLGYSIQLEHRDLTSRIQGKGLKGSYYNVLKLLHFVYIIELFVLRDVYTMLFLDICTFMRGCKVYRC